MGGWQSLARHLTLFHLVFPELCGLSAVWTMDHTLKTPQTSSPYTFTLESRTQVNSCSPWF